jgi:hypothetical protein
MRIAEAEMVYKSVRSNSLDQMRREFQPKGDLGASKKDRTECLSRLYENFVWVTEVNETRTLL